MGLFGNKSEGGLMDVIRCDEQEYLVWKWRPSGEANSTKRENAIRYGSSLRVKDGELAVFVYQQKDGSLQDFIVGPYDQTIKTANFPVLSSIVGAAFGGASPFQAEIYFINLSGNVQVRFGIPYFDVFDPRFLDFAVPIAARGTITFNLTDYKAFIKLNRLINFELEDFNKQIKMQ
jgi:membrane protease subunit (stomatin/prohibitin family)